MIGDSVNPLGMALESIAVLGLVWLISATPTGVQPDSVLLGSRTDPATITQAFTVASVCIAVCLATGAGLSLTLAWQPAASAPARRVSDGARAGTST